MQDKKFAFFRLSHPISFVLYHPSGAIYNSLNAAQNSAHVANVHISMPTRLSDGISDIFYHDVSH